MSNVMIDERRAKFEEWANKHFAKLPHHDYPVTERTGDGYWYTAVHQSWIGWNAAMTNMGVQDETNR